MADNQDAKTKLPPIIGEEYQPGAQKGTLADFERSPASAYEEAGQKEKESEAKEEQKKTDDEQKSTAVEQAISAQEQTEREQQTAAKMTEEKEQRRLEQSQVSTTEEEAAKLAAAAVVNIPYVGWMIRVLAWIVRGLKMFMGEKMASYVAVFITAYLLLAPLNLLFIVGTILQFIFALCISIAFTGLLWKHIKPFVEQAGKIAPTPIKK